jgi:predicted transcriptional regulator
MTHLRIELPDDVAGQLTRLASLRDTTPEALLVEIAQGLLAEAAAAEAAIAEGEADDDAGRVVPFEEAMGEVDAIIAEARARRRR